MKTSDSRSSPNRGLKTYFKIFAVVCLVVVVFFVWLYFFYMGAGDNAQQRAGAGWIVMISLAMFTKWGLYGIPVAAWLFYMLIRVLDKLRYGTWRTSKDSAKGSSPADD